MNRKLKPEAFVNIEYPVTVTGRGVHVTQPLKDYTTEKLSKIERFNLRIVDAFVTLDIQRINCRVDIVLKIDNLLVKSHADTNDMYVSIDQAVDKIESQLRKYHERIRDHQARKTDSVDMNVRVLGRQAQLQDINAEIEEENDRRLVEKYRPHEVTKRETLPLKVLKTEEAIMKMELSGDAFLIFRQEDDRKLKVIYRREDGQFGIIEPE